jgi:ABC-type polysaccharide/polyol phosphate transport system ATPase subunit
MSQEPVITVNALSKTYKLYKSHRDRVKELLHPQRKSYHNNYHALKNFSMTVSKGEIVGIIGQNGSGKSTLLKILCSVVTPSSGNFQIAGRISSILELGGGFSSDLTGIENVYFIGGLQGYKKKEMDVRMNKILEFADLGEYAGQPVKNYSSGMYIRLAFSTAINIDPDILIIDEALAVGDIRFQSKCFRKIREFMNEGKTIVMCTHNLNAVKDFCTRAIWIHKGEIAEQGNPVFVADCYNAFMTAGDKPLLIERKNPGEKQISQTTASKGKTPELREIEWTDVKNCDSFGVGGAKIERVALYNLTTNTKTTTLFGGENLRVYLEILAMQKIDNPGLTLIMNGTLGIPVFRINSQVYQQSLSLKPHEMTVLAIDFPFPHLGNGKYTFSVGIQDATHVQTLELHKIHDAIVVEVSNPDHRYKHGAQIIINDVKIFDVAKAANQIVKQE